MGRFLKFLQSIFSFLRDDDYYNKRITNQSEKLRDLIIKETNWLTTISYRGKEKHYLPFHEQVIKYYEYKNMIIQRRAQYVIVGLTIALLFMTGFQIYLEFFKNN